MRLHALTITQYSTVCTARRKTRSRRQRSMALDILFTSNVSGSFFQCIENAELFARGGGHQLHLGHSSILMLKITPTIILLFVTCPSFGRTKCPDRYTCILVRKCRNWSENVRCPTVIANLALNGQLSVRCLQWQESAVGHQLY